MTSDPVHEKLSLFDRFDYIFYPEQAFNHHHSVARQQAIDQLRQYARIDSDYEAAIGKINAIIIFPPNVYPHASMDRLSLVQQFYISVWLIDDMYDALKQFDENFRCSMIVLFQSRLPEKNMVNELSSFQTMVLSFTESVISRIQQRSIRSWFHRFQQNNQDWFKSTVESNRRDQPTHYATIDAYMKIRLYDVGVLPALDLVEFVHNRYLADDIVSNPSFVNLRRIITEHVAISNDCYSFVRECVDDQSSNNFLAVVMTTSSRNLASAVQYATQRCNDLIREISTLEVTLLITYPDNDDLAVILKGYKELVQGHLMFGQQSSRYKSDRSPFFDLMKNEEREKT